MKFTIVEKYDVLDYFFSLTKHKNENFHQLILKVLYNYRIILTFTVHQLHCIHCKSSFANAINIEIATNLRILSNLCNVETNYLYYISNSVFES